MTPRGAMLYAYDIATITQRECRQLITPLPPVPFSHVTGSARVTTTRRLCSMATAHATPRPSAIHAATYTPYMPRRHCHAINHMFWLFISPLRLFVFFVITSFNRTPLFVRHTPYRRGDIVTGRFTPYAYAMPRCYA